jgi:hypothetical protein
VPGGFEQVFDESSAYVHLLEQVSAFMQPGFFEQVFCGQVFENLVTL